MEMGNTLLALLALLIATLALMRAIKLSAYQKHEYHFFLGEYELKTGQQPKVAQFLRCWWAAMGGPAPAWHWEGDVRSPRDTFNPGR